MDTAPKASGCFSGGTQEIFGGLSEDLLGGTGKAEDAKLQGAGMSPKLCQMESGEPETGTETILVGLRNAVRQAVVEPRTGHESGNGVNYLSR